MANTVLPVEERNLNPAEVDALDRRRRRGQTYLVLGLQFGLISCFLLLWSGQDFTYSPGWVHPMFYWNSVTTLITITCLTRAVILRRGMNEFFSY